MSSGPRSTASAAPATFARAEPLSSAICFRASPPAPRPNAPPPPTRFCRVATLHRPLGEPGNEEALQAALNLRWDAVVKRALPGPLAVPEPQSRRSRTALFIYLLKRHAQEL